MTTTDFFLTRNTTTIVPITASDHIDRVNLISTIVFAIIELLTCGILLLILCPLKNKIWKYASLVQNALLISIIIKSVLDLLLRLPRTILTDDHLPPATCAFMRQLPIFSLFTIYFSLPLISFERFIKIVKKQSMSSQQIRRLFSVLLGMVCILALVLVIIPAVDVFEGDAIRTWCGGTIVYGYGYVYLFTGVTSFIILLTIIFSIALIRAMKWKSRQRGIREATYTMVKRNVRMALALTITVFIATLPYALTIKLKLLCDADHEKSEVNDCSKSLEILFTICVFVRRIAFALVAVVFLILNKALKRRIWWIIRKRRSADIEAVHVSTSSSRLSNTRLETRGELRSQRQPIDLITTTL